MENSVWILVKTAFLVMMITVATMLIADKNEIGYVVYVAEIARFFLNIVYTVRKERK